MNIVNKQLDPNLNVNVTEKNVFKDFLWLSLTVAVVIFALYLFLSITTRLFISYYEEPTEKVLASIYSKKYAEQISSQFLKEERLLNSILANILEKNDIHGEYEVKIFNESTPNAYALPGNIILVHIGLVKKAQSENELAMILGHELGHFVHKDHLHRLGSSLSLAVLSAFFTGKDSALSDLFSTGLSSLHHSYTKKQEYAADEYGLHLLAKSYQHVGGATDFFQSLAETESTLLNYLMNTHPSSRARVKRLEDLIRDNSYSIDSTKNVVR